jgi:hypothetical protein
MTPDELRQTLNDLQRDVMNLPATKGPFRGLDYLEGHRDARHAAVELIAHATARFEPQTCVWSLDDHDDDCLWETSCGQTFQFTDDGGPEENTFRFCYHCGKPLRASRTSDPEGDTP